MFTRFNIFAQLNRIEANQVLILKNQGKIMSALADAQTAQAATIALLTQLKTDVDALAAKVNAGIPGTLTADQQAAIDDITTKANAINTALAGIDVDALNAPPAAAAAKPAGS